MRAVLDPRLPSAKSFNPPQNSCPPGCDLPCFLTNACSLGLHTCTDRVYHCASRYDSLALLGKCKAASGRRPTVLGAFNLNRKMCPSAWGLPLHMLVLACSCTHKRLLLLNTASFCSVVAWGCLDLLCTSEAAAGCDMLLS